MPPSTSGDAVLTAGRHLLVMSDSPSPICAPLLQEIGDDLKSPSLKWHCLSTTDIDAALHIASNKAIDAIILELRRTDPDNDMLDELVAWLPTTPIVVLATSDSQPETNPIDGGAQDLVIPDELDKRRLWRSLFCAIERHKRSPYAALIDNADLALVIAAQSDDATDIRFINRACRDLTGYSQPDFRRHGLEVLLGDQDTDVALDTLHTAIASGHDARVLQPCRRPDGTRYCNQIRALPLAPDGDDPNHVIYSFRNFSVEVDRQNQTAERDRLTALSKVAGSVAHQLADPLTLISGNLAYAYREFDRDVDDRDIDSKQHLIEALEDTLHSCNEIKEVIDALRHLAGNLGDSANQSGPTSLPQCLQSALTVIGKGLRRRVELSVDLRDAPPVVGEASRLSQIFFHLLLHASSLQKTRDDQARTLDITHDHDGDSVTVKLRLSGIRASQSGPHPAIILCPNGSSLQPQDSFGLPVARYIVETLGGQFNVHPIDHSKVEIGFSLPIA